MRPAECLNLCIGRVARAVKVQNVYQRTDPELFSIVSTHLLESLSESLVVEMCCFTSESFDHLGTSQAALIPDETSHSSWLTLLDADGLVPPRFIISWVKPDTAVDAILPTSPREAATSAPSAVKDGFDLASSRCNTAVAAPG